MKVTAVLVLVLGFAAACASVPAGPTAVATLEPRSGSNVNGTVRFSEGADGAVTVAVDLTGATPGVHGFHVHEKGDCSAPDATSAGAHFDVGGHPHGAPDAASRHNGDFGNVTADANGVIRTTFITRGITVSPGETSVVGKAVLLHASPDDLTSQPAGNAGARIACGVANLQGM
jgi:Cu-Zn family superoxide dismutase